MYIEIGDLVFYVYEFVVVLGLVFRLCIKIEDSVPPRVEVEILPPPEPPEFKEAVPEIIEIVPNPKSLRKHPVTKNEYLEFFKEVLTWCQYNIKLGKDRKIRPRIDISFSKKGDVLGYYQYSTKRIMMYVLKNETLRGNVQTFIHEYVHHLQIRNSKDNIRYDSLTRRKGYYDNDYEQEARDLSNQYIDDCCDYLNL